MIDPRVLRWNMLEYVTISPVGIYKQKHSPFYYAKLQVQGRKFHGPTGETSRKKALDFYANKRLELLRGDLSKETKRSDIPKLATFLDKEFLPHVRTRFERTPKTRENYEYGATLINKLFGFLYISQISDKQARELEAYYRGQGLSVATINAGIRCLRRALNLAWEWGRIPNKPIIRLAKGVNSRTRVLSEEETQAYLKWCKQPWLDMARIILGTGARPGEVRALRWESVEWQQDAAIIHITAGKTPSAKRPLFVSGGLQDALRSRYEGQGRPKAGWVFPSELSPDLHISENTQESLHARALRRLLQESPDFKKFPPYTLRHTALTRMAPLCDTFTLAKIAGHTSISMTTKYVHPQQGAIEAAFKRFSAVSSD